MKQQLSAEEITKNLNEALSRREQCVQMQVTRIFHVDSGPANWDAEMEAKPGTAIGPDCKRVMLAAKLSIQNMFELAED